MKKGCQAKTGYVVKKKTSEHFQVLLKATGLIRLTALQFSPLLRGLTPRNAAVGDAVHQRVAADALRHADPVAGDVPNILAERIIGTFMMG